MCELYAAGNEAMNEYEKKKRKALEHFSDEISEEIEDFVEEEVFEYERYLFIRKEIDKVKDPLTNATVKVKKYYAYCTHCKKEFLIDEDDIEYYKHNRVNSCGKCGSRVRVKYARYGRKKLCDRAIFLTYEKSKIDKGSIVARGFFVYRDYSGDYTKTKTEYREISRLLFIPGEQMMMIDEPLYYGRGELAHWCIKDRLCSWKSDYGNYMAYVDKQSIIRAIEGTNFKRFPYKRHLSKECWGIVNKTNDMTNFFYRCCKYPIIEQLDKAGFYEMADYIIHGYSMERTVRWKRKDIYGFMGINKGQAKEIIENKIKCTPAFLKMYKYCKESKIKWDIKKIKSVSEEFCVEDLEIIKRYIGIQKMVNYLEKQYVTSKEEGKKRYFGMRSVYNTWSDYLRDCEKLGIDTSDKHQLMPKDLYQAHQNTIRQIKYKEDKKLNEEIKKLASKREKYKFEFKNLFIRPAIDTVELILEGEELHHCVGGYANRYAKGETNILFIRYKDNPDKPYYTMEVKKGKVVQVRGKNNKNPTEEVEEFVEAYKRNILSKIEKSKKIA